MKPLFKKVDCVLVHVSNLDDALSFYQDALGHSLRWRTKDTAAVAMEDSTELVLSTVLNSQTDLLVEDAVEAANLIAANGGKIKNGPIEVDIGKVMVVEDPFGNELILIDLSKGRYQTSDDGKVTGVK
ncbi:MAG: VOC family protein [Candidatus Saccharimonadales bacterium]